MLMHDLVLQAAPGTALPIDLSDRIAAQVGAGRLEPLQGADTSRRRLRLRAIEPAALRASMDALAHDAGYDWAVVRADMRLRDFRLLVLDMDSTLVSMETIDELGMATGVKAQIAAITEAAMRGEITDYAESLRRRLALLAGAPVAVLETTYARMQLNPGAARLIDTARAAGLRVLLATGGFTWFAERLRERLGLDFIAANVLGIADGRLTGEAIGPIVDAAGKRQALLSTCEALGCAPAQAIAIGDGANDLAMLSAAGLGIAYHAKPAVRKAAMACIDHGGLDATLGLFVDV